MTSTSTTIVIPTWNSLSHLPRCIEALAQHSPHVPIVVVDNGSHDGTPEWIEEHAPTVTLIRNATNEGFGAACNRGANAASTPWLCFLNADAFVTPGWLDALHEAIERTPGAALAGPMFINDDGTLQEAGGILTQSGDGILYGYGEDPAAWEYRFPRVVDYCSAACLLIDRAVFQDLEGFDVAAFGRAYYEDADLCLRAAELGYRTVYTPAARILHIRNASGRSAAVYHLIARNRHTFVNRWRSLLDRRPYITDIAQTPHRLIAARDADRYERLLILCRDLPAPKDPISAELADLPQHWPNMRVAFMSDARPDDATADFWLALGFEVADGRSDWHAWLCERVAYYTTVLALGTDAAEHFGALVDWTQVAIARRVIPMEFPAGTWRNYHRPQNPFLLDAGVDPEVWISVAPGTPITEVLATCGWTADEVVQPS